MYQTYKAIVEPTGAVHMLEVLKLDRPCRAFVTLLEEVVPAEEVRAADNVSNILKFVAQSRLTAAGKMTAQEIEAQIAAERDAWS